MLKDLKSELGQKRQFDPLPATTVCPYERTSSDRLGMSQRCQRTKSLRSSPLRGGQEPRPEAS